MDKQSSNSSGLDEYLEEILSSDDALNAALNSEDESLRAAARLTHNQHPVLSASARQRMLQATLNAVPGGATAGNVLKPNFWGWAGRVAAIFIIAVLVGLAAQPVSANSLPGDTLYPVKLAFEQLELSLASTPEAKVEVYLKQAEERLNEAQALDENSEFLDETMQAALDSLDFAASIAAENNLFDDNSALVERFTNSIENAGQVLATLPLSGDSQANLQSSLETVEALMSPGVINLPDTPSTVPVATPETVESTPEVTAEVTPDIIETTPEVTEEVATEVVETTPEVTGVVTVEVTETPEPSVEPTDTPYTMYIYPDGRVNVRSGAGTDFDIVGVANQNTPVTVLDQNEAGDWLQIRTPNGLEGWVFAGLVDNTPGQSNNDGGGNGDSAGNATGNATGSSTGNATGNASGNSNGNASGNANGNSNGNANGNSNGNANGNSNGNANGNSNGNANGNSNGN